MFNTRKINDTLFYIGVPDTKITLFENMYPVENGMQYNSYLFVDKYTALMDTSDISTSNLFFENLLYALNGRSLDYLVVHHMEPDHCANISNIVKHFPNVKIVGNKKTFTFIEQFFQEDLKNNYFEVSEGSILDLGVNKLEFICAPMIHWPEVMFSYEHTNKLLFSADAFGSFGALKGHIFSSDINFNNYLEEFRRYYINIVGKFGVNVKNTIVKIANKTINLILPLHGVVLNNKKDINLAIEKYTTWSTFKAEDSGVVICYATMHNNSENANFILANYLSELGVKNIEMFDLSKYDHSYPIAKSFQYSHLVITALSYYGALHHSVAHFLNKLAFDNFQNKRVAYIYNSTWASAALKEAKEYIEKCKNITAIEKEVIIKSSVSRENYNDLKELAKIIAQEILSNKI